MQKLGKEGFTSNPSQIKFFMFRIYITLVHNIFVTTACNSNCSFVQACFIISFSHLTLHLHYSDIYN